MQSAAPPVYIGPVVVCVRGPSRSGKSSMVERLVARFEADGYRVAYLKRSHHELDLPGKASARVWSQRPAAMVLSAPDRLQLTMSPGNGTPGSLLEVLPARIDLVLLETHTPEPFPSVVANVAAPAEGETIVGRWSLPTIDADADAAARAIASRMPVDRELDHALRAAMRLHGGHACAGLILGTRLALAGANALDVPVPDVHKRLVVTVETDRCAVDAVQAVTGCRPGKRTLRLLDYGKLAATFIDQHEGRAVRVATLGDLRARAGTAASSHERYELQRAAYLAMAPEEMFAITAASPDISQFDLPGPPRRRVRCIRCSEEVSDGREVATEAGAMCRGCIALDRAGFAGRSVA